MAAPLGFKTFVTGEVLTAGDTNGYLMQGVLVFATSAARTAALPSPNEGQMSFLKDSNVTEFYSGTAWEAVNSMNLLASGSLTGATVTLASIPSSYRDLHLRLYNYQSVTDSTGLTAIINGLTTNYAQTSGNSISALTLSNFSWGLSQPQDGAAGNGFIELIIYNYAGDTWKYGEVKAVTNNETNNAIINFYKFNLFQTTTSAVTSLAITSQGANFDGGTYELFGVK